MDHQTFLKQEVTNSTEKSRPGRCSKSWRVCSVCEAQSCSAMARPPDHWGGLTALDLEPEAALLGESPGSDPQNRREVAPLSFLPQIKEEQHNKLQLLPKGQKQEHSR